MPITRSFLASYYDKYPFAPLSDEVSRLSSEIRSMANDLLKEYPPTQGSIFLLHFSSIVALQSKLPTAGTMIHIKILSTSLFLHINFLLIGLSVVCCVFPPLEKVFCYAVFLQ